MPDTEVTRKLATLEMWKTGTVVFLLIFAITITSVQVWLAFRVGAQATKIEAITSETHGALCAFKFDLRERHDTLAKILRDNPGPFPAASIGLPDVPRDVFESSLKNQTDTLNSLRSLDCS